MRILAGILMLVLSACAGRDSRSVVDAREGDVGISLVAVPAAERMELAPNERFEFPLPHPDNALPTYPEALLALKLPPQPFCVGVSIGEAGEVFRIDPIEVGEDCEAGGEAPEAMREAVFDAVGFWRFEAAFRCVYPDGVQPSNLACMPPGEEVPTAIRMPYRFVFVQRDGKGFVSDDE